MLSRLIVSLSLALLGVFALTAPSYAASFDTLGKNTIMIGTFVIVVIIMSVLFVAYLVKHLLGLDKMPPDAQPEPVDPHH